MRGKTCVWLFWALTSVLSAAYGALSLYTFIEMTKLKKKGDKQKLDIASRWGLFAATLLSFACVAFYVTFTLLVLLRKSFHAKADTGYGIILASAGHTALVLLLSALVIHAGRTRAQTWKKMGLFDNNAYYAYIGTYCVGYILTFFYAFNALVLLFFKPAMDYHRPAPSGIPTDVHDMEAPVKPATEPLKPVEPAAVDSAAPDQALEVDQVKPKGSFFGAWGKK